MIAWLKGHLVSIEGGEAILEVGGSVGYSVLIGPNQTRELQSQVGKEVEFFIYHLVREDANKLYGFRHAVSRRLFDKLLGISGVGPKAAEMILDLFEPAQLVFAVQSEDPSAFTKVPGVGKKTAQKIIIDLKGKLDDLASLPKPAPGTFRAPPRPSGILDDARSALVNLGFGEKEADKVLAKQIGSEVGLDELIRRCLIELKQN
ncbi:MAG: Holliday junction DNA helicase RuvA [Candidatus Lambdaproteobacteria bacterium RIFOXYD12_FULL_49_8]|nr:MAG: Holliday junction DNA helicase RuvA [Candidatus Lambdaproteobacteria bacterium RIFOXYD12_FULL_49_8]